MLHIKVITQSIPDYIYVEHKRELFILSVPHTGPKANSTGNYGMQKCGKNKNLL